MPDLTRKLQTGTMAIECLIWLSGTQGAQDTAQDTTSTKLSLTERLLLAKKESDELDAATGFDYPAS